MAESSPGLLVIRNVFSRSGTHVRFQKEFTTTAPTLLTNPEPTAWHDLLSRPVGAGWVTGHNAPGRGD